MLNDEFSNLDHSTMISKFTDICYKLCKKFLPMKKSKLVKSTKVRIPRHRHTPMRRCTKVQKQLQNKKLTPAAPRGIGVTLNTKGGGENHPTKWIIFTN